MPRVDEYEKKLKQFSFKEAKVWGENADRFFEDAEEMTKWIDQPSIVPFLKCINDANKQSFRRFRPTVVVRLSLISTIAAQIW